MTHCACNFPRLIEFSKFLAQCHGLLVSEHRALAACDQDGVEFFHLHFGYLLGVLNKCGECGGGKKTHTDQVARRIATRVARIAHGIGFALSAIGAEDFDLEARFGQNEIGMAKFATRFRAFGFTTFASFKLTDSPFHVWYGNAES